MPPRTRLVLPLLLLVAGAPLHGARAQANRDGFQGVERTTSAQIPEEGRLTIGLKGEGFVQEDLFAPQSKMQRMGGRWTAAYTPFAWLEGAASWRAFQNRFTDESDPSAVEQVSNVVGDVGVGLKASRWILDWLTVGASIHALLPAGHNVAGPDLSGASAGGALLGTADLRQTPSAWPLRFHLNAGVWADRSESLLSSTEATTLFPYEKYALAVRGDTTVEAGGAIEWLALPSIVPFLEIWTSQAGGYASFAKTDATYKSVPFTQNPLLVAPGVRWSPLASLSLDLAAELSASSRHTDQSGQSVAVAPLWNAIVGVSYAVLPGTTTVRPPEPPRGYLLRETPRRLVLVLNSGAGGRRALSVFDLETLQEVEGSPFDLSIPAERGVLDPEAHRLYLLAPSAKEGDPGLAVFDTRLLKEVSGSPWKVGGGPFGVALDPKEGRLYLSMNQKGEGNLRVWEAAEPKEVARLSTSAVGGLVVRDPSGHRLFLSQASIPGRPGAEEGNAFVVFDTQSLTERIVPAGAGAWSLALDASGGRLFVGNRVEGTVRGYRLEDWGELSGSPFPLPGTGADPIALGIDPGAHRLVAANFAAAGEGALDAWDLTPEGLKPLAGSPFPAGPNPSGFGFDPDHGRFFVADCACRGGARGNWLVTVHKSENLEPSGPGVLQAGPAPTAVFVQP